VQVSQGGVSVHKHPSPDLRADATQDELELVDLHGLSGSRLRGYPSGSVSGKTGPPPRKLVASSTAGGSRVSRAEK